MNQLAHHLVRLSTEDADDESVIETPPKPPKGLSAYMSALGRKGGQVSGKRRMKNLTDEQRQEIALKAARARWAKRSTQAKNKRKPL
ncbi:MAG: hypothetical protein ABMA15_10135 [Vicinamibacterales bacterium]